jgi:hypothetical protein
MEARMTGVIMAVRRGVALLLCPALFLQACSTVSPASEGAVLGRSVIEAGIELSADPDSTSHLPSAESATRFRAARVIPVSLALRNVGTTEVIVGSAGITLELSDGRHLRAIQADAVDERLPKPSVPAPDGPPSGSDAPSSEEHGAGSERTISEGSPPEAPIDIAKPSEAPPQSTQEPTPTEESAPPSKAWETTKETGRMVGGALLGGMLQYLGIFVAALTIPIWFPVVVISDYRQKKAEERATSQRRRSLALERLHDVHLAKGEVAGGILYFGEEGDLPVMLAPATLVVPVRHADTGEERSIRLRLGKEH